MTFLLALICMAAVFAFGYLCGTQDADRRLVRARREARRRRFAHERGLPR